MTAVPFLRLAPEAGRRIGRPILYAVLVSVMVAAVAAAGERPAAAEAGRADAQLVGNPACPDRDAAARQAAQRFADVDESSVFAADIACLAYYGVTVGAGDGSGYAPGATVSRRHMALFMTRVAERAGVPLPTTDQGFEDLEGMGSSARAAVNAAAALGIMPGRSDTEFSPRAPVLRAEMAQHLVRVLELATDSGSPVNATADEATGEVTLTTDDGVIVPDDEFDDIDSLVTPRQAHSINAIYELGITAGKSKGVYDPGGHVTRGQMAAFIVRLLGHTGVRPDGPITLDLHMPGPPAELPPDPDGVYATDPLHLIAYAAFERSYTLPGDDGDVLEVWLCNTPDGEQRYSTHEDNRHNPTNYATKFASQVTAWFEWLSGGLYTPVFGPGGVVEVDSSEDYYRACEAEVLAQDLDRWSDVDGAVVVVGAPVAADQVIGRASCGFFSQRGFPDNGRTALINGDAFTDPDLLAHEMGHALCWPHSYSGEFLNDDDSVYEYDNPMDLMGWTAGEAGTVPMVGTLALNRYAAGWIPVEQVRIHTLGTSAKYELVPPGEDGVQLLIIPDAYDDRLTYWALGARAAEPGGLWWADSGLPAEGVEMYLVDQSVFGCDLADRGSCYGLERRTQPIFDPDHGYDWQRPTHVMFEEGDYWWRGEAGAPNSVIVSLAAIDDAVFTVEVRPLVEEPEPPGAQDWDVGSGSLTAGDYLDAATFTNIGTESAPNWLGMTVRCIGADDLEVFLGTSESRFSGTPVLQYRFGGQSSATTLSLTGSTSNEVGFIADEDLRAFVGRLRDDASGILYVDLWDRSTRVGDYTHEGGGVLGVAGVETQVEPVLQECGY